MKKSIQFILLAACFMAVISCANEADPVADKAYFTKIYDNNEFNLSFTPLDVVQTSDGGYLVLGTKNILKTKTNQAGVAETEKLSGIYLLKLDEFGAVVAETDVNEDLTIPAPTLLEVSGKYYIFCMSRSSFSNKLVEIGADATVGAQVNLNGIYPAAAGVDGTNIMLLHYDNNSMEFVMSYANAAGFIQKSKRFSIGVGEGVEGPIMDGFNGSRKQFPYMVGKAANGLFYFNGFYNYTLSVVFTDLAAENPIGIIQGNQEDGGISNLMPLTGGKYAASRFNFGDNYFLPSSTIQATGTSSSADLAGYAMPELTSNASVVLLNATVNAKNHILYASNTKGKQIALYGYDPSTGKLTGSRYLGFSNTFEVGAMSGTADNGLVIVGTTYIAGRFPRICLFKLSSEALAKSFQ